MQCGLTGFSDWPAVMFCAMQSICFLHLACLYTLALLLGWLATITWSLGWESSTKMALNYCWSSVIDPVCRGYILNEMTGRTIKLNSATYNKLVANGHVVDRKSGVLTPPSKAGDESDETDIDQQPLYTPSRSAKSRLSSGRARRD